MAPMAPLDYSNYTRINNVRINMSTTEVPVHRIALPNPFFEGCTNAYVIAGEPLTLIDTGIGTEDSFQALERAFQSHGLNLADIKQIVLTHHHMDHFGQARRLRDLSGATVFIHHDDLGAVLRYTEMLPETVGRIRFLLEQADVPAADVATITSMYAAGSTRLARSVPAEPVNDGQRISAGGGQLEVIHTPGHTLGNICLRYGRYLFSSDHVLPGISPNIGTDVTGGRLLARYLASLEKVRVLADEISLVFPGHGEPFADLRGRADELIAHHRQREAALLVLVRSGGPQTIYQLATRLFRKLEGFHIVLGAAETWAHLEKLVDERQVLRQDNRFRVA
jgi:glyoxylase-like metal-dependent hydrolase (beta-lactamase superfamily II)